jgi:hypothetical protein
MINGVAVVSAPAEIDIANAEQLRTVLLDAGRRGMRRVVVDMTRTRFCDSASYPDAGQPSSSWHQSNAFVGLLTIRYP